MRALVFLTSVFIVSTFSGTAIAGEPYECGVPEITGESIHARMPTETGGRCDIHDRRFAYREEAIKLRELMQERQENYAEPRSIIHENYNEKLKALNEQRGSGSDE